MLKRWMTGVVAAVIVMALRVPASALGLGDPAPNMAVKEFVKGAPVTEFQKGKIYVVEFWATWCGPCRASIPHLTELAKSHKDTTFVGVSVWETDQSKVKPFVAQMGDKMDYHVAMDTVPAGAKGNAGTMAKTWMAAAGQNGIPTAFIVNKTSRIAWIGHPMAMEEPLNKIEAGEWDLAAAKIQIDREQAAQKKMEAVSLKLQQAGDDPDKQLAVLNDALTAAPDMEATLGSLKLSLLLKVQPTTKTTAAYAEHLTDDVYKDRAEALDYIAELLIALDQPKRSARLCAGALKAAQRADGLTKGRDAYTADTLARAYFCCGDTAKALETQQRAVALAKGTPLELSLLLRTQPDAETTAACAAHLADGVYKDSASGLNALAWSLVEPDQPKRSAGLYAIALKAAQRADELTQGKDAATADTLGRAYFCTGDTAKALETQQRAVALSKGAAISKDDITAVAARLEEYQKAANK